MSTEPLLVGAISAGIGATSATTLVHGMDVIAVGDDPSWLAARTHTEVIVSVVAGAAVVAPIRTVVAAPATDVRVRLAPWIAVVARP